MGSPTFGHSGNKKSDQVRKPLPANLPASVAYEAALLTLEKNLRLLSIAFRKIQAKRKREAWYVLKNWHKGNISEFVPVKVVSIAMETQRKLQGAWHCLEMGILKRKLRAWNQIKQTAQSMGDDEKNTVCYRRGQKKGVRSVDEWKENSASNLLDLSLENKRLKHEIAKQQASEESFIEKMSTLLDSVQKPKSQVNKKKR